jgi:hypothetical protein
MTRPYSLAFKQKMVERLIGKHAVSALQLARETGVRQQNLSRWLEEARSLPLVAGNNAKIRWTVEQKARLLTEASGLSSEALRACLDREGVRLVDFERWRIALEDEGRESSATTKRIRQLERELARKEKALAEAAALLVLKKTVAKLDHDGDERHRRSQRELILRAIAQAQSSGARLRQACRVANISARTIERWRTHPQDDDGRCGPHHRPKNALMLTEEAQIVGLMRSSQFAHLSPKQLVPRLAHQGLYLASESTFYRLQRRYGLRATKRAMSRTDITRATTLHRATRPNQVWSWDINGCRRRCVASTCICIW